MADVYVAAGGTNTSPYETWTKAATSFATAVTQAVAGDTIYVDAAFSENTGATTTYTFVSGAGLPVKVISATNGTTTPAAGASVNSNGNFEMRINGWVHMYGMTISVGTNASQGAALITLGYANSAHYQVYEGCTFYINSTSSAAWLYIGTAAFTNASGCQIIQRNCIWRFATTTNGVFLAQGVTYAHNIVFHGSSAIPATLFKPNTILGASHYFSGCNFSASTNLIVPGNTSNAYYLRFSNCAVPATIEISTALKLGGGEILLEGCSNAGNNNWEFYYLTGAGKVVVDNTAYLTTGGATSKDTQGETTTYSLKFTPSATYCGPASPLRGPWISYRQATTGSKTISLKVAHTESAVLTDNQIAIEVDYMGGAAAANLPQSQLETSAPLVGSTISRDVLAAGSNLSDTAEAWTGVTTPKTHTLSKTVTVNEQGYLRARVVLYKATTNPVYADAKITVV